MPLLMVAACVTVGLSLFSRVPIRHDLGFLLTNFGLQNLVGYGCQFALQVGRIVREEQLLSADDGYRTYKGKVRFRVIPGLF